MALIRKSKGTPSDIQRILRISPHSVIPGPLPTIQSMRYHAPSQNITLSRLGQIKRELFPLKKVDQLKTWAGNPKVTLHSYCVSYPHGAALGMLSIATSQVIPVIYPSLGPLILMFLSASWVQLILTWIFLFSTFVIGFSLGLRRGVLGKKAMSLQLKQHRKENAQDMSRLHSEALILKTKLALSQVKSSIFEDDILRYRETAQKALGVNKVIDQLLKQEFSDPKVSHEICSILGEVSSSLRKASQGLLPQSALKVSCVNDEVKRILEEFRSIFKKTKTSLFLESENKFFQEIDAELMGVLLRKILLHITSRFLKDHNLTVRILDHMGATILFEDNGYVFKQDPSQTLETSIEFIQQQATSVGWKVTCKEGENLNETTLYIPDHAQLSQGNIISMLERVKHV